MISPGIPSAISNEAPYCENIAGKCDAKCMLFQTIVGSRSAGSSWGRLSVDVICVYHALDWLVQPELSE